MPKNSLKITRNIILYDCYLNWVLGLVLTAFADKIEPLITTTSTFPATFYLLLGLGFFAFATWQTFSFIIPNKLTKKNLIIAAWLAWVPTAILSYILIILNLPLQPYALILLWIGNIYMFFLGWWYWLVAQKRS